MDIVVDAFNALRDDANRDEELRNWFKDVDASHKGRPDKTDSPMLRPFLSL
jgi:hypothetical protein